MTMKEIEAIAATFREIADGPIAMMVPEGRDFIGIVALLIGATCEEFTEGFNREDWSRQCGLEGK